jgi:restriction system protein
MANWWMSRAEGGELIEPFKEKGVVALGWNEVPSLATATSRDAVRELLEKAYPDNRANTLNNAVAMMYRFRNQVQQGDRAVTYDPDKRQYLIGDILSDYLFDPSLIPGYPTVGG